MTFYELGARLALTKLGYIGPNLGEDSTGWAMRRSWEQATDPNEQARLKATWQDRVNRKQQEWEATRNQPLSARPGWRKRNQ